MLSVQKFPSDKTGLRFVKNIFMPKSHSTNFVPSSKPPVSEVVKPSVSEAAKSVEVTPPRKIRVDLKVSKPKKTTLSKDRTHDKPAWVCHFCGNSRHKSKLLQAASCLKSKQTKSTYASSTRSYGTYW